MALAGSFLFLNHVLVGPTTQGLYPRVMRVGAAATALVGLAFVSDLLTPRGATIFMSLVGPLPSLLSIPAALRRVREKDPIGTTLLVAWLVWILTDTAVQHSLGLGGKKSANARALTMLPLIRNVLFVTIAVIALIVALANMGMNVTPLLAGAGVIGLAIGFGAQSLVADLITGLFIIIEDSLSIDDYVDVGGHQIGRAHV